jgi:hypothetical protein
VISLSMDGLLNSSKKWKLTSKIGKERVNGNIKTKSLKRDTPNLLPKSKRLIKNFNKLNKFTKIRKTKLLGKMRSK